MKEVAATKAWCVGSEQFADCANCYRQMCEKRTVPPLAISVQSTMVEAYGSRGHRKGVPKGD